MGFKMGIKRTGKAVASGAAFGCRVIPTEIFQGACEKVVEIAEEDRNPKIPQRLREGLSPELERTLAEKAARDAKPKS